jgi:hypothetical protein
MSRPAKSDPYKGDAVVYESRTEVKISPHNPQGDEAKLAAILDIVKSRDIKAKEKCSGMAALLGLEQPAVGQRGRVTDQFAWEVWKKTNGFCTYCNEQLNPFDRTAWNGYQIDHVIPHAQGGTDDVENLTPACGRCNWSKYARTPEEWGGAK